MIVVIVGAVLTALFGFLWIRDVTSGLPGGRPSPQPAPPADPGPPCPKPSEGEVVRYPRSKFLEGDDARPRRGDRRSRHAAGPRLRGPAAVHRPGPSRHRRRLDRRLSREQVRDHDVPARPRAGRGLAAHRVHPQQRPPRRRAELHDPLEPLRPSRLPGAGERPAVRRAEGDREDRASRGRPDPDRGRRRLRLPVPRRPVRHRGQPHGRPAGPRARPLRVPDRQRTAAASQDVFSVSKVDGEGADAKIHSYPLAGPGQHVDGIEAVLYPIQPPR